MLALAIRVRAEKELIHVEPTPRGHGNSGHRLKGAEICLTRFLGGGFLFRECLFGTLQSVAWRRPIVRPGQSEEIGRWKDELHPKPSSASAISRRKARGVTDEELILFQTRNRGGVNPRDRFDWANNWKDAVAEVLGSRGKLEKAAAENTETFATYGATFTNLSDKAYATYKASQLMSGFKETAEEQFKEAGTSITEFETNRELLLEMFDERLRLETFAVLDKFEGGLLLTKERLVDSKEGRKRCPPRLLSRLLICGLTASNSA